MHSIAITVSNADIERCFPVMSELRPHLKLEEFVNVITLGLSPTRQVFVRVAASALLIDTRTGFIYAALEANEKRQVTSNAWESRETADRARRDAEKTAFQSLVSEFEKNWPLIIERAKQGA